MKIIKKEKCQKDELYGRIENGKREKVEKGHATPGLMLRKGNLQSVIFSMFLFFCFFCSESFPVQHFTLEERDGKCEGIKGRNQRQCHPNITNIFQFRTSL